LDYDLGDSLSDPFTEVLISIMTLGLVRLDRDSQPYDGDCEIIIRVSVESITDTYEPFEDGSVISSRSDSATIYYNPFE
jgi:hypothetical protein